MVSIPKAVLGLLYSWKSELSPSFTGTKQFQGMMHSVARFEILIFMEDVAQLIEWVIY